MSSTREDLMKSLPEIEEQTTTVTTVHRPNDLVLANIWRNRSLLTSWGMGEWKRYSDGTWSLIPAETIAREILDVIEMCVPAGIKPSKGLMASVMELARVTIAKPDTLWNSKENYLVCKNGVLGLAAQKLYPHSPDYYATSGLSFDYDPEAKCPTWDEFLDNTIPESASFLQEFAGYALTTDCQHETAVWLYGPRGSGKSTFLEGICSMLGERHTTIGLADIEKSQFSLWNLQGKTLVTASEQPALYIQSTHKLNAIISGERILIEQKFRNPVEIRSHCKIIWAMNELPRIPEATNGLFRRVKVIKFPDLPSEKRNPAVKEHIKNESAGILNWALAGLKRLVARGGFEIPQCVVDATEEFELQNDIPALFLADCCNVGENMSIRSGKLYTAYTDWCMANGHKAKSSTAIAADWKRFGWKNERQRDGIRWAGVELRDQSV